jgi:hypothetical protein
VTYHGTCWDHRIRQDYGYFQGGSLTGALYLYHPPMLISRTILVFQQSRLISPLSCHIHLESAFEAASQGRSRDSHGPRSHCDNRFRLPDRRHARLHLRCT